MLSKEDNELLTRVGPGTPMGELIRSYWVPLLISSELPERDGAPLRVRVLGEDLIAFRDSRGRVGLLDDHCSHRGASLFFGRNEEDGLRCVYHGWKYDVDGRCVDMPNEPAFRWTDSGGRDSAEYSSLEAQGHGSSFREKVRHKAYRCQEQGGVIWAYMGPREAPPSLPKLEWLSLPDTHIHHSKILRECNWVQGMEGDIDSSHVSFLHSSLRSRSNDTDSRAREMSRFWEYEHRDRSPRLEVVPTDCGVMYGSCRDAEEDTYYWRIAQFLMPFYTMIPPIGPRTGVGTRIWVPADDEHTWYWQVSGNPSRPTTAEDRARFGNGAPLAGEYLPNTSHWLGRWRLAANKTNDYLIDREAQRTENFTGLRGGVNLEDQAITESMGPIVDRTQEHLGSADSMIVETRARLMDAARALRDEGVPPPGVDDPSVYWVRPASVVLPRDANWVEAASEHLVARPGVPVASV